MEEREEARREMEVRREVGIGGEDEEGERCVPVFRREKEESEHEYMREAISTRPGGCGVPGG